MYSCSPTVGTCEIGRKWLVTAIHVEGCFVHFNRKEGCLTRLYQD